MKEVNTLENKQASAPNTQIWAHTYTKSTYVLLIKTALYIMNELNKKEQVCS